MLTLLVFHFHQQAQHKASQFSASKTLGEVLLSPSQAPFCCVRGAPHLTCSSVTAASLELFRDTTVIALRALRYPGWAAWPYHTLCVGAFCTAPAFLYTQGNASSSCNNLLWLCTTCPGNKTFGYSSVI